MTMDPCRRPLGRGELAYLADMGRQLHDLRERTGLSRAQFGAAAQLSRQHVARLERGERRTRYSTLGRISEVLAMANPELGPSEVILGRLVTAAGPTLATESEYAARVAKRRKSRVARRAHRKQVAAEWVEVLTTRRSAASRHALSLGIAKAAKAGDVTLVRQLLEQMEGER
jgi:transcriptional regulator with XRE-family HTH domain